MTVFVVSYQSVIVKLSAFLSTVSIKLIDVKDSIDDNAKGFVVQKSQTQIVAVGLLLLLMRRVVVLVVGGGAEEPGKVAHPKGRYVVLVGISLNGWVVGKEWSDTAVVGIKLVGFWNKPGLLKGSGDGQEVMRDGS